MYRAILITEFLKRHLEELAGEAFGTPWEKEKKKALKRIKDSPGISRRDFYRALHINADEGNRLIRGLSMDEEIRIKDNKLYIMESE